jgi:transcriptional regulator of arginine metabolism
MPGQVFRHSNNTTNPDEPNLPSAYAHPKKSTYYYLCIGDCNMKAKRHDMISKLIASENIETQEELAGKLREHGFSVTQATVSRDIKELRLIKVLTPEGRYRYATVEKAEADLQERFIRMFSNCVLSVTSAGNMIVIKTIAGSANAAAEAVDTLKWPDILGSIAGDNTIFIAVRDAKSVGDIIKKFQKMLK